MDERTFRAVQRTATVGNRSAQAIPNARRGDHLRRTRAPSPAPIESRAASIRSNSPGISADPGQRPSSFAPDPPRSRWAGRRRQQVTINTHTADLRDLPRHGRACPASLTRGISGYSPGTPIQDLHDPHLGKTLWTTGDNRWTDRGRHRRSSNRPPEPEAVHRPARSAVHTVPSPPSSGNDAHPHNPQDLLLALFFSFD